MPRLLHDGDAAQSPRLGETDGQNGDAENVGRPRQHERDEKAGGELERSRAAGGGSARERQQC